MYQRKRLIMGVLTIFLANVLMFSLHCSKPAETSAAVLGSPTPTPGFGVYFTLAPITPLPTRPIPTTFPENPPVNDELTDDTVIYFPDYLLEQHIRKSISKSTGDIFYGDVKELEYLSVESVFDFEGIQFLTNLNNLYAFSKEQNYTLDLSAIRGLKNLTSLNLNYYVTTTSDLVHLSGLNSLTNLSLSTYKVRDLTPIGNIPNLEELTLTIGVDLKMKPLNNLKKLHTLYVHNNSMTNLNNYSELNIPNLTTLSIAGCKLNDINGIANMRNLTKLNLGYNKNINDISVLSGLTELTYLSLTNNSIIDVSPLCNLTNLEFLYIGNNPIVDAEPLSNLTNLNELNLSNTSIEDVSPLSSLDNLSILDLSNTSIKDASSLSSLVNLKVLYLKSNPQLDVSTLSTLPSSVQVVIDTTSPYTPSPTPFPTRYFSPKLPSFDLGDVNVDGKVDSIDFGHMRMRLLGITKQLPYEDFANNTTALGDLNGDGKFNSIDFAKLRQYLTGKISQL